MECEVIGFISLASILLSALCILCVMRIRGLVLNIVTCWLIAVTHVVVIGHITSALGQFGSVFHWALLSVAVGMSAFIVAALRFENSRRHIRELISDIPLLSVARRTYANLPLWQQFSFMLVCLTSLFLIGANCFIATFAVPHQWDSLTYHIARVAYYLQHGSTQHFASNYWAQVVHPNVSPIINAYAFLISGRTEQAFSFLQLSSYFILILTTYGTALRLFKTRILACILGLLSGLLVNVLMQATTPQNDLFMAALISCVILYCTEFRRDNRLSLIILSGIAIGLGVGTKASFLLLLPAIVPIALWSSINFFRSSQSFNNSIIRFGTLFVAGVLPATILFLPSGYINNILLHKHPLGPLSVRNAHTFGETSFNTRVRAGAKNLLRFSVDAFSLECPSPVWAVSQANDTMRGLARGLITPSGIDLTSGDHMRVPFSFEKANAAHEDGSYFGILGFGLMFPSLLIAFFFKKRYSGMAAFVCASVFFMLAQSFAGPYDPWRGRYFVQLAPFAIPLIGCFWQWSRQSRLARSYLIAVLVIACVTAVSAVFFRRGRALVSFERGQFKTTSFITQTRLQQLTANRRWLLDDLQQFEATVPLNATVGIRFPGDMYEYPLFGKGLTRIIIPLSNWTQISNQVDYVVSTMGKQRGVEYESFDDIDEAERWTIRRVADNE